MRNIRCHHLQLGAQKRLRKLGVKEASMIPCSSRSYSFSSRLKLTTKRIILWIPSTFSRQATLPNLQNIRDIKFQLLLDRCSREQQCNSRRTEACKIIWKKPSLRHCRVKVFFLSPTVSLNFIVTAVRRIVSIVSQVWLATGCVNACGSRSRRCVHLVIVDGALTPRRYNERACLSTPFSFLKTSLRGYPRGKYPKIPREPRYRCLDSA